MAYSMLAIAVIGFLVWGHHMFVSGQSMYASLVFSILSFVVAVPSAIKVFNWTATCARATSASRHRCSMRSDSSGLFMFGGLTGLMLAAPALDVPLTDTYFVVAHFHYVMVGGSVMAYLGGIHYWWPKITGRLYPEGWARFAAILMFFGFNLTFFPQYLLGYEGMPRRYFTYLPQFQVLNVLSSAGASILAVGYVLPALYLLWSLRYGAAAGNNPWNARGLEWQTSSPPPQENFTAPPVVREAYAYDEPRHERATDVPIGADGALARGAVQRCRPAARGRHARHVGIPRHRDPVLRRAVCRLHYLPRAVSGGFRRGQPAYRHAAGHDRDGGAAHQQQPHRPRRALRSSSTSGARLRWLLWHRAARHQLSW